MADPSVGTSPVANNGTISAFGCGSDATGRRLLVFTCVEKTSTNITAVTVDGKSFTLVDEAVNTNGAGNSSQLWEMKEATLSGTTGSNDITFTGGSTSDGRIAILIIDDNQVDFSLGTTLGLEESSTGTAATAPGMDYKSGDYLLMFSGNGAGGRTIGSLTSPLVTLIDGIFPGDMASGDMAMGGGAATSAGVNVDIVLTWSGGTLRTSAICIICSKVVAGGSALPMPQYMQMAA